MIDGNGGESKVDGGMEMGSGTETDSGTHPGTESADDETWPALLALPQVLVALAQYDEPGNEAVGLRFAAHPDPDVRGIVPALLEDPDILSPAAREALCALMRDPSTPVRRSAVVTVAEHPDTHPALGDALAQRFGDEDEAIRVHAVFGLAERDDPRCVEGSGRIGPVEDPERYGYGVLDAARRYEDRRAGRGSGWRWRRR